MIYNLPQKVLSPKRHVSNVRTLIDTGIGNSPQSDFSLAIVNWSGENRLAMRWNASHDEWDDLKKASGDKPFIGNPTSRGYSTWFIVPPELCLIAPSLVSQFLSTHNLRLELQTAIMTVLISKTDESATFQEIADEINQYKLYIRKKDGKPVKDEQIKLRTLATGAYANLFEQLKPDLVKLK